MGSRNTKLRPVAAFLFPERVYTQEEVNFEKYIEHRQLYFPDDDNGRFACWRHAHISQGSLIGICF